MVVFLKYNWFPAKVFMGDAGSLFVGINMITYTIISIKYSYITPYILFIIYSYFLIDTLGTLVIRTFLKKKWKNRHRSHPYQNYSKKYGHNKMSLLVQNQQETQKLDPRHIEQTYFAEHRAIFVYKSNQKIKRKLTHKAALFHVVFGHYYLKRNQNRTVCQEMNLLRLILH